MRPEDHPQNPDYWVAQIRAHLAEARSHGAQRETAQDQASMRCAGIASVFAARATRDEGRDLHPEWSEALAYDKLATDYQQLDPLMSEYYREQSIRHGLFAAIKYFD